LSYHAAISGSQAPPTCAITSGSGQSQWFGAKARLVDGPGALEQGCGSVEVALGVQDPVNAATSHAAPSCARCDLADALA